jgi:hypothetical protein
MVAPIPTRRQVVLAAAAALPLAAVTGCSGLDVVRTPPPPPRDVELLQGVIAAEQLMVDRYHAVLAGAQASSPALVPALVPLLSQHQEHLAQLRARLVIPRGSAASASPSPSPSGTPAVPSDPAAAIAFLKEAEQAAATALLGRLPQAPASLAQLFASVSASEATHVPALAAVSA